MRLFNYLSVSILVLSIKIWIHGTQVVENAMLSIDLLSEKALEARNKDMKNFQKK